MLIRAPNLDPLGIQRLIPTKMVLFNNYSKRTTARFIATHYNGIIFNMTTPHMPFLCDILRIICGVVILGISAVWAYNMKTDPALTRAARNKSIPFLSLCDARKLGQLRLQFNASSLNIQDELIDSRSSPLTCTRIRSRALVSLTCRLSYLWTTYLVLACQE